MFNKNIAFVLAIVCCSPSYALLGGHDHDHAKEESKINSQKLDILNKELEEMTDTEKKLILNEKHMSSAKICFWLTLAGGAGAAASLFLGKNGSPNYQVLGASGIIGGTAALVGAASSYNQNCVLHNITESKKQTILAISNVKQ